MSKKCIKCKGAGTIRCPECHGKGRIGKERCSECNYDGSLVGLFLTTPGKIKCGRCDGTGSFNKCGYA